MRKDIKIKSPLKKKILLILASGVALGLARKAKSQKYILKSLNRELREIERDHLLRIVREFKYNRMVDYKEKKDGSIEIVISEKGKSKALEFDIDKIKINKPVAWDKKWRVVFFDIPEKRRSERNILREKLQELGFKELQKSIFLHPYPCLDEINFITEYYQLRNLVRYGEMINISNEEEFKLRFNLF